jgi:hypothetical protein
MLSSVSPNPVSDSSAGPITLTATGHGFTALSRFVFNGAQLATIANSGTALSATLPTSLVTKPGAYPVFVRETAISKRGRGILPQTSVSNSLTLAVEQQATDFELSASPVSLAMNQWAAATSTITVTPRNGIVSNVNFIVSGLPSGVMASFGPSVTAAATVLTLQATDDLPVRVATVTITALSGGFSASTTILLSLAESAVPRGANAYCDENGSWTGSRFDSYAEAPRTCFRTDSVDTPSPGNTVLVPAGGSLTAALTAARCGDTIALQAGATFLTRSGAIVSRGCDDQHWITVRTSASDSLLPPEHTRINPSFAGVATLPSRPAFSGGNGNVMAKIIVTSNSSAIIPGDHYRFISLEVSRPADGRHYNALFRTLAAKVILDRCWIHGDPVAETGHLVQIGPGTDHLAVIDSYLSDAHCTAIWGSCTDSQAVPGVDGGSTIKLVNNFLEASGENILLGGGPATMLTSDVEVRLNHLFKPMSWNPADPSFIGIKFIVKNILELKEGQRVFIEGNFLENTWGGFTQTGSAILLTPKNQAAPNGGNLCPICLVSDVTLRYNYVRHGATALTIGDGESDNHGWPAGSFNYSIHDLIFDGMQYPHCHGCAYFTNEVGSGYDPLNPPPTTLHNASINHITLVNSGFLAPRKLASGFLLMAGPPKNNPTNTSQITDINWQNSIMATGSYAAYATGGGAKNCSVGEKTIADMIAACWINESSFVGNLLVMDHASKTFIFPNGNQTSPTWHHVGFVNFHGGDSGDYHLSTASPYKGSALDGLDPGADVDGVMAPVASVQ